MSKDFLQKMEYDQSMFDLPRPKRKLRKRGNNNGLKM